MTRPPRAPLAPAALAPVLLGAALAAPTAAEARRGDVEGLRLKPSESSANAAEAQARGKFFLQAGDPVKALAQFRQALAADPGSIEALNGMAVSYDRLGRYDVARSFYEAALGLAPEEPMLLNNYGYSLFLQGDLEGAARYLGMAVASGDPDVQAASLSVLARIDAARAKARPAVVAAPVALPEGPRVVRTSSYEQRLVLGGARPAPAAVAALGEAAVAVVEVAALSPHEEQRIAVREAALDRADAQAEAAAAAQAQVEAAAEVLPAWPDAMRRALELDALVGPQATRPAAFPGFGGAASPAADLPLPYLLEARRPPSRETIDRRDLKVALLATGVTVQRKAERPQTARELPPAEPLAPRRSFDDAFDSDDSRLNSFAARVQGLDDDVAAKVARLEALIDRMRTA